MSYGGNGTDLGTLLAAADLSGSQYCFGIVNSAGALALAGAGTNADGVILNKPLAGTAVTLRFGGVSKVKLGGTVAAGAPVTPDAAGKGVTATTGNYVAGKALVGGVAGDIVPVLLRSGGKV